MLISYLYQKYKEKEYPCISSQELFSLCMKVSGKLEDFLLRLEFRRGPPDSTSSSVYLFLQKNSGGNLALTRKVSALLTFVVIPVYSEC